MKTSIYFGLAMAALACTSVQASGISNNYNFAEAGYQKSNYNRALYYGSYYTEADVDANGYYLRGSFNFYDNFFAEVRKDRTYYSNTGIILNSDWTIDQNLYALGYFHTIDPRWSVYGTVGFSELEIAAEAPSLAANTKLSYQMSGASVEIGTRFDVVDFWQIEPAVRYIKYDQSMYEVRLNNAFSLTKNLALNLNAMHRSYDTEHTLITEVSGQIGLRYSF